jgi:hypothetical protein
MLDERAGRLVTIVVLVMVFRAAPLAAQPLEIVPTGGYRFGSDLFETAVAHRVNADGAPLAGLVFDAPLSDGLQFEALFTRQQGTVTVVDPYGPPARFRVSIDNYQAGGLQELSGGRVRPFLTGVLGLTRFGVEASSEWRFTVGGGGGAKLFATRHVGVRLDGRIYATFIDADAVAVACNSANGTCFYALRLSMAWQAEFTAGLVVRIP